MGRTSGTARSCPRSASSSNFVDALVETLEHPTDRHPKDFADSEEGSYGDGSASFDLLPMSR